MNVINLIELHHLKGEQRELAELIGIEAYRKIIANYGGEKLFVSRLDSIISANRVSLVTAALMTEPDVEIMSCFHLTKREFERIKLGCK